MYIVKHTKKYSCREIYDNKKIKQYRSKQKGKKHLKNIFTLIT